MSKKYSTDDLINILELYEPDNYPMPKSCAISIIARLRAGDMGVKFIEHIQAHLLAGEKVVCKICGMTADEILGKKPTPPTMPVVTDVRLYLVNAIVSWRKKRDAGCVESNYYIDAFQSVHTSLFGELVADPPAPPTKAIADYERKS